MAPRTELVPLALALALIAGVGAMAVHARQAQDARAALRARTGAAATPPAGAGLGGVAREARMPTADHLTGGRVNPSDLGAFALRTAALPAPTRDVGAIRRTLRLRETGTYIAAMLAQEDSVLARWPDRTVAALRVWVQPRADVAGWNAAYPQMVRDVFPEWSAAGFPLRFLHVVDSTAADVHIRFVTTLPGRNIGLTNRLRDRSGWIVGGEIIIATHSPDGQPLSAALVHGVARHEVGHVLGLGHAPDRGAVMFPEAYTTTIGSADRATLHLLYMLPPGSVR